MATAYATVAEYRTRTGDQSSDADRVQMQLEDLSAQLRSEAGIREGQALTGDQALMCRSLVCDAASHALVSQAMDGFSGPLDGARQASFSAGGFQQTVTFTNPTGAAYFDRSELARLKRSLGTGARWGFVWPGGA
ncbi:MAG: hypothetical protein ACI360_08560 [Atopobiaceae bacterium]